MGDFLQAWDDGCMVSIVQSAKGVDEVEEFWIRFSSYLVVDLSPLCTKGEFFGFELIFKELELDSNEEFKIDMSKLYPSIWAGKNCVMDVLPSIKLLVCSEWFEVKFQSLKINSWREETGSDHRGRSVPVELRATLRAASLANLGRETLAAAA
ncbi:hypothetical protein DSO57_1021092 [Entomophthora muscae]|uniref:Uncharacterized protein n=1 Tax=Entomophthora muscae TaxID=34485 RepID=A0ACC2TEK6_9FUNG|nr:hypothetical protein DSO57_1021092 [Entomophthora muscae]